MPFCPLVSFSPLLRLSSSSCGSPDPPPPRQRRLQHIDGSTVTGNQIQQQETDWPTVAGTNPAHISPPRILGQNNPPFSGEDNLSSVQTHIHTHTPAVTFTFQTAGASTNTSIIYQPLARERSAVCAHSNVCMHPPPQVSCVCVCVCSAASSAVTAPLSFSGEVSSASLCDRRVIEHPLPPPAPLTRRAPLTVKRAGS